MDGVLVVHSRSQPVAVEALAMKCDAKEIPDLASGKKADGWWLAKTASYSGTGHRKMTGGQLEEPGDVSATGTVAIAVGEGRLIGIVSPNDATAAVWFSWQLSSVKVAAEGSTGMLKKRPTKITVTQGSGTLTVADVSKLLRSSGSYQSGQENSLLKALGH